MSSHSSPSAKRLRDVTASSLVTDKERHQLEKAFVIPSNAFVDDVGPLTNMITFLLTQCRAKSTLEGRWAASDQPPGSFDPKPEVLIHVTPQAEDTSKVASYEVTILFPHDTIFDDANLELFRTMDHARLRVHYRWTYTLKDSKGASRLAKAFTFISLQRSVPDYSADSLTTVTQATHYTWHSGDPTTVSMGYL